MRQTTGPALPAGVKQLRERIERWRRTRDRRTAMPADLWTETIAVARAGRPYTVARALRVNFEALRRRMAEAATGRVATTPGAFVELTGAQILGPASVPGTLVELSDSKGTRVTVRLAAGTEVDVPRVVAAFRQGRS